MEDTTNGGASEDSSVVVIGADQAGVATGYFLRESGLEFTILADDERIGDTWRERWDSLELFTPAFFNGLSRNGVPRGRSRVPPPQTRWPFLEVYAREFDLPVRLGTRVTGLRRDDGRFRLETSAGEMAADQVVVATGGHSNPHVPSFADELPDGVFGCHSSEYENPDQLRVGDVLVVGAGNSGTQIAAGVERVGRITGVEGGQPVTDGGKRFDVNNVVWCTGFRPDFSWIDLDVLGENGHPRHTRGIVEEAPGLYFVGLPWLYRPTSSLIGGVGKDAEHVATHIQRQVA